MNGDETGVEFVELQAPIPEWNGKPSSGFMPDQMDTYRLIDRVGNVVEK